MARIIAIDYGTKRVGLAVTDPLQIIANPLDTVHAKDVIAYLEKYLQTEAVEAFVVGQPLRLDGSDSQSAVHVEKFVSLLRKKFPDQQVFRADERFTSKIAQQTLLMAGKKKKNRQGKKIPDKNNAEIIFQTFF